MLYNETNEKWHVKRYMTYLPHSGFHNQRIAFENALVLAYALRRTLIIPPIRLGNKPIRYVEYDTLVMHHELSTKDGLQHCLQVPSAVSSPLECLGYFTWTTVPWIWLVNLTMISNVQPLLHLPSSSQHWFRQQFNLTDDDIEVLRDETPYQFRFLDTDTDSSPPTDRYSQDVHISDLATSNATLLQFGTLFGTSRLRLRDKVQLDYQRLIRENMAITNQDLTKVVRFIALQLQDDFVSVHLRAGDGHFKHEVSATVNNVWRKLLRDVMHFSDVTICDFAREVTGTDVLHCSTGQQRFGNCTAPLTTPKSLASKRSIDTLQCRSTLHQNTAYTGFNMPLYVATDLRDPEIHPDLELFRITFPCIFFLNDFLPALQPLKALRSPYDGVDLYPFLLPLVDGMVASEALRFVGTEGSTFSKFVMNLWKNDHEIPGSH
ncbi:hypothetical protein CPB83DRAFT_883472 [Crepidotus variabilis]|uniref:Uncharacterized protein n=1 Tax=Crepidotus variabilis TaxID=179855 RepID=A0A9P6EGK9_9AGAR|nr:hypothetical protein CPB83DRAFT_883472 [Crepidotus variabilis]